MRERRKTRGQIVEDAGDEAVFGVDEGPLLSGDENENVLCGRCDRTLLLGVARENAWRALRSTMGLADPHAGTAAADRPYPVYVECDCGATNRIWPIIPL